MEQTFEERATKVDAEYYYVGISAEEILLEPRSKDRTRLVINVPEAKYVWLASNRLLIGGDVFAWNIDFSRVGDPEAMFRDFNTVLCRWSPSVKDRIKTHCTKIEALDRAFSQIEGENETPNKTEDNENEKKKKTTNFTANDVTRIDASKYEIQYSPGGIQLIWDQSRGSKSENSVEDDIILINISHCAVITLNDNVLSFVFARADLKTIMIDIPEGAHSTMNAVRQWLTLGNQRAIRIMMEQKHSLGCNY